MSAKGDPPQGSDDELSSVGGIFARHYRLQASVTNGERFGVWRATDLRTDEPVALKFFPAPLLSTSADILAVREILTPVRNLGDRRVVAAHQIASEGHLTALVTPWVEGATLAQLRQRRAVPCFEVAEIEPWVRELIDVLEIVHARGLFHGALRPESVFVHETGGVRVIGWGIDAWLRFASRKSFGPPKQDPHLPYCSPELRRGAVPQPTDDVYAFGALVYELLAGSPPRGPGWLRKHRPPVAITKQRRANRGGAGVVPAAWESMVLACLQAKAAARLPEFGAIRARVGLPRVTITVPVVPQPRAESRVSEADLSAPTKPRDEVAPLSPAPTPAVRAVVAPPPAPPAQPVPEQAAQKPTVDAPVAVPVEATKANHVADVAPARAAAASIVEKKVEPPPPLAQTPRAASTDDPPRAPAPQPLVEPLLPPRPPRRHASSDLEEPLRRFPEKAPKDKPHYGRWGTRALSALLVLTVLVAIAVGGLWGWRMYESGQEFDALHREVQAFPVNASAEELQAFEERLFAARARLNTQQWQKIRDTWTSRRFPRTGPELSGTR